MRSSKHENYLIINTYINIYNIEQILKNWSKKLNWWKCNSLSLLYPVLAVDEISLKDITYSINNGDS